MHRILHWLHELGDPEILALVLATMTLGMMAAPHIGRRLLWLPERKERDEAVFSAFNGVVSMLGVVLAFSLVQANATLRALEGKVTKEAAAFVALDGLPVFFWTTIVGLIGVAFCLATLTTPSLGRTVAVGAAGAAIALLLAFVIIVDIPFEGERVALKK